MYFRFVFGELLHEDGTLDPEEWALFRQLYDRSTQQLEVPKICIWVDTPAEVCFERARKRGREAETPLTLAYLKKLEAKYHDFLSSEEAHFDEVYRIDGRQSAREVLRAAAAVVASKMS
ncbi:hypothetical protein KFL_012170030 [Klebsormidium nitens]|uniref:Deoxynucleoside kinase domain-containing protein n=1 Tax=Klebsormidium nitens TaxID=105231 RepID=A0A1Y1IW44_KLENI|nr:hypothetical protein KFL_012170030 [Klebsormidium nitens]|eukprot:GAQ92947.1 hypothetical protein KFL_012170030 [Klebsormidium nitens]